ncbi:MAG: TAXI family TRAP transporter solute-binding subunit [Alphaproteobacteria bacterium]
MFSNSKLLPGCITAGAMGLAFALGLGAANAEMRVTYKSAKTTSSYYQMAVQLALGVKAGTNGEMTVTVEESQGSVQNVKQAAKRPGNYVFTTPPVLVKLAMGGKKMFEKDGADAYASIRSLFPIPYLTMHLVMRADLGVKSIADLEGKKFLTGKGSFGAREAVKYLKLFGLDGKVDLVDVELNAAVQALKNRQIDGFATAGSYPAPNVMEAGAGTAITLVSFSDDQIAKTKRAKLVIPAGTYPGIDTDVNTTTLPVGAYTTTAMDEAAAYAMTKAVWEQKAKMGSANAWWNGVTAKDLGTMAAPLHPGARRYYDEAKVMLPANLK